jgi:cytochrome P450
MTQPAEPHHLSDASFFADPYPTYARLRSEAPACFVPEWNGWAITRYADVAAGFRDPRLSATRGGAFTAGLPPAIRERLAPLATNLSAWALLTDPPAHTRLRALINKAFTPQVAQRLRPAVVEIACMLLDEALGAGTSEREFDVVAAIANPLPVLVIGDLLGLPREDRHRLKRWSDALAAAMGGLRPGLEVVTTACDAVLDMERYFRAILAARRHAPGEDLLSQLAAAREDGKLLDEQELLSTCTMVLFGGHETTTNLIANGLLALVRHPEQLAHMRSCSDDTWPRAVDELLRFDSPVQRMGRVAKEDFEVSGRRIAAGDRVFLVMGAAHRDERAFARPDRLDVLRTDNRHLAFGLGAHYCVGAALGRMEAEVALGEMLRRIPRIELAQRELRWAHNATIRGLESLSVSCTRCRT